MCAVWIPDPEHPAVATSTSNSPTPMRSCRTKSKRNIEKESDIVRTILEYLQIKGHLCKRNNAGMLFVKGSGGKRNAIKIGEKGWPDIEGITGLGKYFGIEVKTQKGRLTPDQEIVGKKILKKQGIWFVARSLDDVIDRGF